MSIVRRIVAHAPRVLLIEDDPAVCNATRMLLRVEGYEVITADSLGEALRQAAEQPDIELLIADYHLGNGETGIQVIAAVRQQAASDLKAVLITGDISPVIHDLQRDEHLRIANKPMNADEFLLLLREFTAR